MFMRRITSVGALGLIAGGASLAMAAQSTDLDTVQIAAAPPRNPTKRYRSRSKYMPHQGPRECARRVRQMEKRA